MATKLYLHNASETVLPNLPSAEQSTLTANDDFEADQTTNRKMDTVIGTAQASLANSSISSTSLQNYYVARFVSKKLNQTSIAANTWTWNFAAAQSNAAANFPVAGNNQVVYVNIYVWRTSNGTKVGTILDGNTAAQYNEPAANNSERVKDGTFSGAAVSSLNVNDDVIIIEVWFRVTQAMGTSYTQTFYFDGTTENTTEETVVSDHASFIETPENISFVSDVVVCTVDGKTVKNKTITHI